MSLAIFHKQGKEETQSIRSFPFKFLSETFKVLYIRYLLQSKSRLYKPFFGRLEAAGNNYRFNHHSEALSKVAKLTQHKYGICR